MIYSVFWAPRQERLNLIPGGKLPWRYRTTNGQILRRGNKVKDEGRAMRTFALFTAFMTCVAVALSSAAQATTTDDLAMMIAYAHARQSRCFDTGFARVCDHGAFLDIDNVQSFSYQYIGETTRRVDVCTVQYHISTAEADPPNTELKCSPSLKDGWILEAYRQDAKARLPLALASVVAWVRIQILLESKGA